MFSLIESKEEISKAHKKLVTSIQRNFKKKSVKNIGYPGGTTYNATVHSNGKYWFWTTDHDDSDEPNPRKLNWFGLFSKGIGLQITVEINTPYVGQNGQIAGYFARNNKTGAVYLMHSGRVGGGTKGVGKATFLAWSEHPLIEVACSSGKIIEGIVVMPVEGMAATRPAITYVDTIVRFKEAVRNGDIESPEFKQKQKNYEDYYAESRGRRKGKRSANIDYLSRHGDVVEALHVWRKKQQLPKGGRLVKNVLIDLGVQVKNVLTEVYEVKTSSSRSDIYTALGQLFVHGTDDSCKKVMVLPNDETLALDLDFALKKLNIDIVKFELDENEATII